MEELKQLTDLITGNIIGTTKALAYSVHNMVVLKRNTRLKQRLTQSVYTIFTALPQSFCQETPQVDMGEGLGRAAFPQGPPLGRRYTDPRQVVRAPSGNPSRIKIALIKKTLM